MLKLINVNRINYDGRHNAFTDLVEWKNKYYLVFRSGERHIAPPHGKIVLLVSEDLANWEEAAIFDTRGDNRDAKLLATPDKLIVYFFQCADRVCRMQAVYTTDGLSWSDPAPCYDPGYVVWRPKKAPDGTYYVAADSLRIPGDQGNRRVLLNCSKDGLAWQVVSTLFSCNNCNETEIEFYPDGEVVAVVRGAFGEGGTAFDTAALAFSKPPYIKWTYYSTRLHCGGPALAFIEGRMLGAGRKILYDELGNESQYSTVLFEIVGREIKELMELPSGGDCSYPAFLYLGNGEIALSYYSSHEASTSVYTARLKLISGQ